MGRWSISGSYFEVCTCDAICPCRSVGGSSGGRSTYGVCQFTLSWLISDGEADGVDLGDRAVVMAGWYDDDEEDTPIRVTLYVDDRSTDEQFRALSDIFLGRAGTCAFSAFTSAIDEVHHVRRAAISLSHQRRRWAIKAATYIDVAASTPVESDQPIVCAIPGRDHPGDEVIASHFIVNDDPLQWTFRGRCGFTTNFTYQSVGTA